MLFLNKKQKFLSNDTFTLTTGINGELLTTSGILTNEANVGFEVPEGQSKYLTAGNDVVDLSKWNGTGSVNIGDIFSSDNDKVTVMAKNLAAGADLKLTSIENLEIINSGVTTSVTLTGANFKGLEAIKLIGDKTTLNVSGLTQGIKVDATANADYITGSSKADTINGGAGNDTINAGSGNDVLTGGNGADTFIVGSVQSLGIDQILDFSAEDKISMAGFTPVELKKFDASTFSTVTYKTLDSVLATFGSGGANATGSGDVVIFSYDGKTYALLSTGIGFKEATDALVDITGANVASLTETNFGDASSIPTPNPNPGPNPGPNPNPDPTPPQVDKTYATYADFKADATLGDIAEGQLVAIETMTVTDAKELATNKTYLDKIAAGGIKAITGNVIEVTVPNSAPYTFNAATFDSKLDPSIITAGTVTMNITGNNGNADTIAASVLGGVIDGTGSTDTIKLNTGKDVVKISSNNGTSIDNIINFDVTKDVLSFENTTAFNGLKNLNPMGSLTDVSNVLAAGITNATVNTVYKGTLADLKKLKGDNNSENKIILGVATDVGSEGIYSIKLKSNDVPTDVFKVVTLTGVNLESLTMDNFTTFA